MLLQASTAFLILLLQLQYINGEQSLHIWNRQQTYYYKTLEQKLSVIGHEGCQRLYSILPAVKREIFEANNSHMITVTASPVEPSIMKFWKEIPSPKQMRVDPNLCDVVYTKRKPIFNNTGCQLPHYMNAAAPRCQTDYLKWICDSSRMPLTQTISNHFILPEANHAHWHLLPPMPFVLSLKEVMVSQCGQISAACGFIHTNTNCRASGFYSQAKAFARYCPKASSIRSNYKINGNGTCQARAPFQSHYHYYDRVFVVAQVDDTFVYHIHLEIIPRILYYLDWLIANPDVKILYGCDTMENEYTTNDGLRQGQHALLLMLAVYEPQLQLTQRLILHENIFAKEVYLPMEGACQDPVYNTWMILDMRQRTLQRLNIHHTHQTPASSRRKVMTLMKRSANSDHSRNRFDLVRQWSDHFTKRILQQLHQTFPQYEIRLYSDRNDSIMHCFDCQIRFFAETDILIGVHGAGLGMALYMPPNSAVVEFAPYGNDGRCLLGGGPFSRLAAVLGHNYMIHHPLYQEFIWKKQEKSSEFNITSFVTHIHSFLASIDFL
jgi:hypothetical protein